MIVVGSGATGSIAVKELTERGLDVLLLEAGREVTEADFTAPPPAKPRPMGMGLLPRFKASVRGQHVQSRRAFFSDRSNPLLVDDRANPYTNEPGHQPYLWIRGRVLGGRLHTYGQDAPAKVGGRLRGWSRSRPLADSLRGRRAMVRPHRGVHRDLREPGRPASDPGREGRRAGAPHRDRAGFQGKDRGAVAGAPQSCRGAMPPRT